MVSDASKQDVKWAIALLVIALLGFSAGLAKLEAGGGTVDWWTGYDQPATAGANGAENLTTMTGQLMTGDPTSQYAGAQNSSAAPISGIPLVAPFEILSVLLVAALVGAVAVAIREKDEDTMSPPEPYARPPMGRGGM
ncbi:MAG: hypothetical protein ACYDDF_02235 [Thermoplasmatota archaeon]